MTPERMRVVLAEWDGRQTCGDCDPCVGGRPEQCAISPPPDYPNDWNAIHELVNKLDVEQRLVFLGTLAMVTARRNDSWLPMRIVTSTPTEWCEALLRTLNLWEEE